MVTIMKKPRYNPIIGYHIVDKTYRVIGPPGTKMDPAFGTKARAQQAAERYGKKNFIGTVIALHLAGLLSVIFHDVGDIQLDGESAKRLVEACRRNNIQVDRSLEDKIEAEEKEPVYSSRQLLKE